MIVTVGDASPRQARGHIGNSCVKWKHFLSDVSDVTERVEMRLKPGCHMIVTVIVFICRRLIGDTSPMCRSRSPIVAIIFHISYLTLLRRVALQKVDDHMKTKLKLSDRCKNKKLHKENAYERYCSSS